MPREKQRTPQLRDHVLSAAVGLLAREGVSGFTARSVARAAQTSTPAVYELFGDKSGLVREVFFEGFRLLRLHLDTLTDSADPLADLVQLVWIYRGFMLENPVLSQVMFARPFSDFEPDEAELQAGTAVRTFIVERVRRCIQTGSLHGDATDIAHVLVSLIQGLAAAENARRLGTTKETVERRWTLATTAILNGLGSTAPVQPPDTHDHHTTIPYRQ
jgi:AcrR family transcriptional regulator